MKTLRFLGMALMAVLMCVNFASCSNEENEVPQVGEEIMVSLGFGGEISVSESPLSRTEIVENPDLYAIQIYSCPIAAERTEYEPFMHGIFDNVSSLTVPLITGYKYKFEVLLVKNAKNILQADHTGNNYGGPFMGPVDNTFTTSISGLNLGRSITLKNGISYVHANIEKYYGMTIDFTPSAENKDVTIKMKKMFFGATFVADQLTEGTLSVNFESAPQIDIVYPETTVIRNFAMNNNMQEAYTSEDYTENLKITITWKKADGAEIPFGSHTIGFKRNKMHTITIKVADMTSDSNISIELDDEEMGTGDNTTIENGEIVDTNIKTE